MCNLDVFGAIWLLAIGVNFLTHVSNTEVFVYFIKEEDLFIKIKHFTNAYRFAVNIILLLR